MISLVLMMSSILFGFLVFEYYKANSNRKKLQHIVYVNGTRGKSTVTRLIHAGLNNSDLNVFAKTTGTIPMILNCAGEQKPLKRRGRANIKEQLAILNMAVLDNADILVLECMAVDPVMQYISQHKMVKADVAVITNVRLDHTDIMGETIEEICDSLSNTIPTKGLVFTADERSFPQLLKNARSILADAVLVLPTDDTPDFDWEENIELALKVCTHLGVERCDAIEGMRSFIRDPYALALYAFDEGGIFVNGMSINDPQSICMVFNSLSEKGKVDHSRLTILINSRPDRGFRTLQMLEVVLQLGPQEVWLVGANQGILKRKLQHSLPKLSISCFKDISEHHFPELCKGKHVFSIGNLAGPGIEIIEQVQKEGLLIE